MLISLSNDKGGAGKTTSCVSLAAAFASAGEHVLVIDTDTNATATRWLTGRTDARDFITNEPVATSVEEVKLTRPPIGQLVAHVKAMHATGRFDQILIDLPGVRDQANLKAMLISDLVIVPAAPHEASYDGAVHAMNDLTDVMSHAGRNIPCRLLLTQVKQVAAPAAQAAIINQITAANIPRFETCLMQRAAYEEIGLTGQPPHSASASRDTIAKAVAEIDELLSEINNLMAPPSKARAKQKVSA
jgi:chromosome partitioning protein